MNVLPATVEKAGTATLLSHSGGRRTTVPIATPAGAQGGAVTFGVRPEDLSLATGKDCLFEGKVDYIEQLGEVQLVYVDIGRGDQPLTAKLPGNVEVKRGATVRLDASAADLHIFDKDGRSFLYKEPAAEAA